MGKNKEALRKRFIDLCKAYADIENKKNDLTGMQRVQSESRSQQLMNKLSFFKSTMYSVMSAPETTKRFLNSEKLGVTIAATYSDAKRSFILDKLGIPATQDHDIEELKFAVSFNEPRQIIDNRNKTIDNYAKKHLSPKDYQEYINEVFASIPIKTTISNPEEIIDIFLAGMTEDQAAECRNNIDLYKIFDERTDDELQQPIGENYIPTLETNATSAEEIDAIEYIKQNVKVAIPEYGSMLSSVTMTMMGEMTAEDNAVTKDFLEENPKYKDVLIGGISGGQEVNPDRLKVFEELKNAEYRLSENTKNAMKQIMHKIDDMGIIDQNNINEPEEGTKKYAMVAVFNAVVDIEDAMIEGKVKDLPKLVEKHRVAKLRCDELLNIANENFCNNKLLYGANVDVARTSYLPIEYRRDNKGVSQVSELMNCVKLCKQFNVPIDEFVEKPRHYLTLMKQDLYRRYDINTLAKNKSLGDTLYMLSNKPDDLEYGCDIGTLGLIMRAEEGFKCFDPNEIAYNTMLQGFSNNMGFENLNVHMRKDYLQINPEETICNMIIFGKGRKIQEYTGNMMAHYDFCTNKNYEQLDADRFLKHSDNINYDEIGKRMVDMYADYMSDCITDGKHPNANYVKAMKGVVSRIRKARPQDAKDEAFLRLKEMSKQLTAKYDIENIVYMIDGHGKDVASEKAKNLSLNYLKEQKNKYNNMDWTVRFASWLPFVNNNATKLRHAINDEKAFLVSKGVNKAEIDRELDNPNTKLEIEKNPDLKVQCGKFENVKIYDVSGVKAKGYNLEADINTYQPENDEPEKVVYGDEKEMIKPKTDRQEINVENLGSLSKDDDQKINEYVEKTVKKNQELDKSDLEEFIDVNQIDLDKSGIFDPEQIKKMLEDADKEYGNLDDLDNDKLHEKLAESSNLDTSTKKTEMVSINDSPAIKKTVEP